MTSSLSVSSRMSSAIFLESFRKCGTSLKQSSYFARSSCTSGIGFSVVVVVVSVSLLLCSFFASCRSYFPAQPFSSFFILLDTFA